MEFDELELFKEEDRNISIGTRDAIRRL